MSKVLNTYFIARINADAPNKRRERGVYFKDIAHKLGISYFTLRSKINGYGRFTKKQIAKLKELYAGRQAT